MTALDTLTPDYLEYMALRISESRLRADFDGLTADGATPDGGLDRPALSSAHLAARTTFSDMILSRGFEMRVDGAGNLSAVWTAAGSNAPTLLLGSHLDSVPNGGRFDGALGVAAAFEVLQTLRDAQAKLDVNIEVIDFTDEEGTWISLCGSRAAAGQLTARELANPRGDPDAFNRALDHAGLTHEGMLSASRINDNLAGYMELHIEQGTRLEEACVDVGVVTGMVGIHMYLVTFHGRANHAGTTPMNKRLDAAQGASAFCLAVRTRVMQDFPDCVATVGRMDFAPGAFNIIAERVTVFMELRSDNPARAQALAGALGTEAAKAAKAYRLEHTFDHLESVTEQAMDPVICGHMEDAARGLGLSSMRLPSLAGHDAQSMALLCPAGLLFVPSVGGFSHSSAELTDWKDCVQGANILLHATLAAAGSAAP